MDAGALKELTTSSAAGSLRPTTIRSADGRLDVTLNVEYGTVRIGRDDVKLRMYNGNLVGPVLRAKAGDTLYITLNNRLPLEPAGPHGGNGHHEWNTTNLHFHGLHVAPQGPAGVPDEESDNVLLELKPSNPFDPAVSTQKYKVQIPANHVAGTFWYHAHKHGAVAAQVSSGLAGALIIERDDAGNNLDSVPEVAAAAEELLVLQEIPYLKTSATLPGEIERSPDTDPNPNQLRMFSPGQWKALKRYITVNGEKIPTITMAPGEVRRFRFVHTGQRESVQLRIERAPGAPASAPNEIPLHEIAVDGLPTGSIRTIDRTQTAARDRVLELFSGYRSDVLVQAPAAATGDYYLVDTRFDAGGTPRPDTGADGSPEPVRRVAKIVVSGTPVSMSLPAPADLLPHRLNNLLPSAVTGTQYAFYGLHLPANEPVGFFISRRDLSATTNPVSPLNAKDYDPSDPRTLTLGRTERWLVGSRNDGVNVTHPFHIHVNPFLITKVTSLVEPSSPETPVDVTAREIGFPTWRDTLAMKQGYTYELLTRYDDYFGAFVDHCHILDHEDNGMMELVRIDSAVTPTPLPIANRSTADEDNAIATSLPKPNGEPSALFFVQGSACPHCMTQLTEVATKLADRKLQVAVVSASTEADLRKFPKVPFRLVADPDLKLFKEYDAFDGKPKHATIVRDRSGKELLRKVGDEPFMDATAVLASLNRANPRYVISVRKTDDTNDDYLTWAPIPCQIRLENGTPGGADVTVTLTNDPPATIPDGGDVRFATTLAAGQTATAEMITVDLKQDGTPVDFFMAGFKASKLTTTSLADGGRDAIIEIHEGGSTGPKLSETAVMVRVRKDISKLSPLEMNEFLKAVSDLHLVENRYEWYVLLHRLATVHGAPFDPISWPDQAHLGPAFIAWHRAFLLQFERELQIKFPHVALPYWVQGKGQTFYSRSQLGENIEGGTEVVGFDRPNPLTLTGSPLYGWSIALQHDTRLGTPGPMGFLRRSAHNHNLVPSPTFYQQWGPRLQGLSNFKDAFPNRWGGLGTQPNGTNPNFNVERNPHNVGHGRIGPDDIWMQNCRESNADPVFWVFHCNHDYLWAKWQQYHNRFENQAGHPENYWPSDAFTDMGADTTVPRGHHLNDKMWPWDGSTSTTFPGDRPDVNGFGDFPQAPFPFQWPPAPAQPRPADVIDYLNVTGSASELGFCYDDVGYGAVAPSPSPPVTPQPAIANLETNDKFKSQIFLNNTVSPDLRLAAVRQLEGTAVELNARTLLPVIRDVNSSTEVRAEALRHLATTSPKEAVSAALQILGDQKTSASLGVKAVEEMGHLLHFSSLSHADMAQIHDGLRGVLTEPSPAAVKAAALRHLAPNGDSEAKKQLVGFLQDTSKAPLSISETISLLRFFPDQYELIRQRITSPNEEIAIAAIHALFKDTKSAAARRQIAADRRRGVALRKVAIQSIMHDDASEGVSMLVKIFSDAEDDLDVRAEAIAAAKVYFQRTSKKLSAADKSGWTGQIQAVATGAPETSELGAIKTLALDVLTTK